MTEQRQRIEFKGGPNDGLLLEVGPRYAQQILDMRIEVTEGRQVIDRTRQRRLAGVTVVALPHRMRRSAHPAGRRRKVSPA